jgi:hypothetical protein
MELLASEQCCVLLPATRLKPASVVCEAEAALRSFSFYLHPSHSLSPYRFLINQPLRDTPNIGISCRSAPRIVPRTLQ